MAATNDDITKTPKTKNKTGKKNWPFDFKKIGQVITNMFSNLSGWLQVSVLVMAVIMTGLIVTDKVDVIAVGGLDYRLSDKVTIQKIHDVSLVYTNDFMGDDHVDQRPEMLRSIASWSTDNGYDVIIIGDVRMEQNGMVYIGAASFTDVLVKANAQGESLLAIVNNKDNIALPIPHTNGLMKLNEGYIKKYLVMDSDQPYIELQADNHEFKVTYTSMDNDPDTATFGYTNSEDWYKVWK